MKKHKIYLKKVNDEKDLDEKTLKAIDMCLGYSEPWICDILNEIVYKNEGSGYEMSGIFPSFDVVDGRNERYDLENDKHYLVFWLLGSLFNEEHDNALESIDIVVEYSLAVNMILERIQKRNNFFSEKFKSEKDKLEKYKITLPEKLIYDLKNKEFPEDVMSEYESPRYLETHVYISLP